MDAPTHHQSYNWKFVTPQWQPRMEGACCFVCGETVKGRGVPLLAGLTLRSHTPLPSKIGQLLGEGFVVVVQTRDVVCRRCQVLIDRLDELEGEVLFVQGQLAAFLHAKYQLDDPADIDSEDNGSKCYDDLVENAPGRKEGQSLPLLSGIENDGKTELQESNNQSLPSSEIEKVEENALQESVVSSEVGLCDEDGHHRDKVNVEIIMENSKLCASASGQFSCSICGQSFSSNKGIQRHVMQQHLSTWVCHFCNVEFRDEHEYTSHLGTHLTGPSSRLLQAKNSDAEARQHHRCTICEYRTADKQSYDQHVRSHVVLKLFKCEACGRRFANHELLMKHLKTCSQSVSSRCSYGEVEFESVSDMADHMMRHDTFEVNCGSDQDVLVGEGMQNCFSNELGLADCVKTASVEDLQNSELVQPSESEGDAFQCNICFETFVSKIQYDDHLKTHSSTGSSSTDDEYKNKAGRSLGEVLKEVNSDSKQTNVVPQHSSLEISMFSCSCGTHFNDKSQYEKHKSDEKHFENNEIFKDAQCVIDNSSIQMSSVLNNDSVQVYESHIMQKYENLNVGNASIDENGFINIISCEDDDTSEALNGIQYVYDMGTGENITLMESEEPYENQCAKYDLQEIKTIEDNAALLREVQKKAYLCAECGFQSPDLEDIKTHLRKHKDRTISSLSKEKYSRKRQLLLYCKKNKITGKLTCLHCFHKFDDTLTLHQHTLASHPTKQYHCIACNERFLSRKELKLHEDTHYDNVMYRCDCCSQEFSKERQLKHHKDMVHRDPHCRFCGKEILKAQTLKNHELRHTRQTSNFECDICKRVFKTKTGLRHHVASHTGEYKFCCDYCGRGFMSRMMMEEHRSMHTKEERYVCDVCGRKFSFQSTYWIHRKWHDTPYPYKCNFCGRMFRHSSLLAVHKRKHTGERPYKCPHCSLTFPVGGTLKRHVILHTGVYPFNCDKCKRGFTTKHKYASHLAKVHSDYNLLGHKPLQNDFKMVVREEPTGVQENKVVWRVGSDETKQGILELPQSETSNTSTKDVLPHDVQDNVNMSNIVPTRVVKIVLEEGSQAMATVTLAERGNVMPDLWYQQENTV
ncbi:zinc finger protein 845-like isoform X3 [Bacillus rossius redtenbacheri]|uniref:zinc finger protein 845-like isoform X3 n=1 Tax=Bacillus rossius redtenbacheri TaxID=93214 RepID=UPI002FDCB481